MTWPNDRKFVDKDGKILDHWQRQLQRLSPLLEYSPTQFAALQALISASLETDEEADPGAAINLAFPIDSEPLADEDWLIEYKNSANAGRRVPISSILALVSGPAIVGTATLTGSADVSIAVPSGYRDIEVRINGLGLSTTSTPTLSLSEDSGSTFVNQLYSIFTDGFTGTTSTPTSAPPILGGSINSVNLCYGSILIQDYLATVPKFTINHYHLVANNNVNKAYTGSNYVSSTAPINLVKLAVSGATFTSGTISVLGTV